VCGFESRRAHVSGPHPWDYPWREPAVTGVVRPGGVDERPLDGADLRGRVPLLAVGSNASPRVLRRKLGDLLADGMPVARALVHDLAVGHSAHVSAGGYVPAAPVARAGAVTTAALAWATAEQLEALDVTEPNYVRVELADVACRVPGGAAVEQPQVYESRHGVLADGGRPLPLRPQPEVLAWLGRRLPGLTGLRPDEPGTYEALAVAETRERIREAIAAAGLTTASGLKRTGHGQVPRAVRRPR
jgi:hypothetical protein